VRPNAEVDKIIVLGRQHFDDPIENVNIFSVGIMRMFIKHPIMVHLDIWGSCFPILE